MSHCKRFKSRANQSCEAKLTRQEIDDLVSAFSKSKRAMTRDDGLSEFTGTQIDGWANKLRVALNQADIVKSNSLRQAFHDDKATCIEALSAMASDEYTKKFESRESNQPRVRYVTGTQSLSR